MDKTTVGGIIFGLLLLGGAMALGAGGIKIYWNLPSLMITCGGTLAATLINYTVPELLRIFKVVKVAFLPRRMGYIETIEIIVKAAQTARKEGLLALEKEIKEIKDNFLREGLQLVIDGAPPDLLEDILFLKLDYQQQRHKIGQGIFETMAMYAPAFGMAGTLIGLIRMLLFMSNPSTIGPAMSVALLTTLYGVLIAYLIFYPIAGKLKTLSSEEKLLREIMVEGILSIQRGDNPYLLRQKLLAFLPSKKGKNEQEK
jgi:chemotaxis protein MotA